MGTYPLALIAAMQLQGVIALVLLWMLGSIRLPLVGSGAIDIADIALSRDPWPKREKQIANAFDNQFQLPVLFYVACGLALYLGAGLLEVALAWCFLLSRLVHAAIFVTTNNVVRRFTAYTAGFVVLIVFWVDLIVRVGTAATQQGL